jgi:cytochrome c oxidase cbb3-type subunit 3
MSNDDNKKKDVDELSGVETTGHEWDGLKELNNPLPRWWVWVFLVCCLWSAWYFVIYPSWPIPGGATEGTSGYTQFKELQDSQKEILARQQAHLSRFESASYDEIMNDQELYTFAMAGGASAFKQNCATCHGSGAEGGKGYPNLNDDDWLWGGKISDINQTLLHGIRADNWDTRMSQMPAFGSEGLLKGKEIGAVADYVLTLSGGEHKDDYQEGQSIFQKQCASCHGTDGKGSHEFGAPNLTDKIWLYGGKRSDIYETIMSARAGMMPAWKDRLDENTIRQLSIYVHQRGGGEVESAASQDPEPLSETDGTPQEIDAAVQIEGPIPETQIISE